MRLRGTVLMFLIATTSVFAQSKEIDDATSGISNRILIQYGLSKLDSIELDFYQRSDSLKSTHQNKLGSLESAKSHLQNKLDSLAALQLPTAKITKAIDSVNLLHGKTMADFNEGLQGIKDQTTAGLKALKLPPELNEKVSSITGNIEGFKIPTSELNPPSLNLADNPLGKLDNLNLSPSVPTIDNPLGTINTPELNSIDGLKNVTGQASEIKEVTGQVSGYGREAQQLAKGNLSGVNELPERAEAKAVEMSGLSNIKEHTQSIDRYKDLAEQAKDPDAVKEQVIERVQQAAINHFAGKEQQLQEAMETVAKYKKQYASVPDISKLPKKRPNEMKDKPLIDRLVPGIAFQIQKEGEDLMVDFNPYVGYRFTGRITGGLGWNQRLAYNTKQGFFNSKARVYGPRAFGEYNLWKGFCPRAEMEVMNTFVPPFTRPATMDLGSRQWVWGVFVGMKKDYRFLGGVRGTAMVMTRLFDPKHKSPYGDVINARFGFEFPVKRKTQARPN